MAQTPEHSDDERVGCQEEELIRQAQSQVMLVGALVRDVVHLKIGLQAGKQAVRQSMLPTCASCTVVSQPTHSFLRPAVTELHNGFRACTSEVLSQPLRQPRQLPGHWRRNVIYTHTGMQAQQILGFQGFTISSGFSDRVPLDTWSRLATQLLPELRSEYMQNFLILGRMLLSTSRSVPVPLMACH